MKNKKHTIKYGFVLGVFVPVFFMCGFVSAYEIVKLDIDNQNDFILEPGKMEILLDPGQSVTKFISITNRTGKDLKFKVEIEDFTGSYNLNTPVVLLGDEKGPYSLKDYLNPSVNEFNLAFQEKITFPVKISVPETAEPGGFYGSVLISNSPAENDLPISGGARVVSRLASLFFVRVSGETKESGRLEDFKAIGKKAFLFVEKGPITFRMLFRNDGNVHLVPYGRIKVNNFFGQEIASLPVDGYFAMPESLRNREIIWNSGFMLGRYTASLALNRGYGDLVDEQKIAFWVIPWKLLLTIFIVMLVFISSIIYISKNFEFKRRD